MRTRTPFIEAFRKQQVNKLAKPVSTDIVERDLSPKSMSDSYHKVVCHIMRNLVQASQLIVDRSYH
jgi:acyl-coenzyme A thioesterase 9